ncbi:MAG: hypothetical protein ACOC24_02570 [Desulfovibrionales bacterium]
MMNNEECRFLDDQGLVFFGRIAAGVSHEIKNHLAVINEQSGLMSDLVQMSNQGSIPTVQRLAGLSRDIAEQVKKADLTVKIFGRFSHSVDEKYCSVDLDDLLEIMAGVARRPASGRGVSLVWKAGSCPVNVLTSPFQLEQLVFLCLEHMLSCAEAGGALTMEAVAAEGGAAIELRCPGKELSPIPESRCLHLLQKSLQARVSCLQKEMGMRIDLPRALPAQFMNGEKGNE